MTTSAGCGVDDEADIDLTVCAAHCKVPDEKFDLCAFHELRDPLLVKPLVQVLEKQMKRSRSSCPATDSW